MITLLEESLPGLNAFASLPAKYGLGAIVRTPKIGALVQTYPDLSRCPGEPCTVHGGDKAVCTWNNNTGRFEQDDQRGTAKTETRTENLELKDELDTMMR